MTAAQKHLFGTHTIAAILVSVLICTAVPHAYAQQASFETVKRVVAIDPGHGGNDTGARGLSGVLEKTVSLNLARVIAKQLAVDYRVVLTRNDDYGLDDSSRAAAANNANADMFISLHIGNSFIHDINRTAVYFYLPFQASALTTETRIPQDPAESHPLDSWHMIQTKYRAASQTLANQLQTRLTAIWPPQDLSVQGIPMPVLEGADMPAVAIEIGNLANTSSEKALTDPRFLSRVSEAIVSAVGAFLMEKPK